MSDFAIITLLIVALFAILGSGVWIGLTLSGVAWIGMELFSSRPAGDAMSVTICGSASSWTLTALPLFIWMGEILFRTRLSESMFKGLAPWVANLPGRLLHQRGGLHHLRGGVGLVGRHLRHHRQDDAAGTLQTRLSRSHHHRLAGRCRHAGPADPPSIIMIVYGVTADVSIAKLFAAGIFPGILLAGLFAGYLGIWALLHPDQVPRPDTPSGLMEKLHESRHLIPVVLLIGAVLVSLYAGIATATEAAAVGVVGSLILSGAQGSLNWATFKESLLGATRLYCMIGLILSGAAFLTLAMGYIGLPRHLAEWVASLGLTPFWLMVALAIFYILLGCFLDGISMVVLTMGVILPTVQAAGFDLIWFGIFLVIVVEMAQITPPVGFNLFVLQGMTGREISWIAKVTMPFFLLMCAAVLLLWLFPGIATWLPGHM